MPEPLPPSRQWRSWQTEIYENGLKGVHPQVTTNTLKLEAQAKGHVPEGAYWYVAGGAGIDQTGDANRHAFQKWQIVPRMLPKTLDPDLGVELFGDKHIAPIILAPVGVLTIMHRDGESAVARATAETGITYCLSSAASTGMEDVAAAQGDQGKRWYQLYWPGDAEITKSLLSRAKKAGYKVLVVTLDTPALGWRPADLDGSYLPFPRGIGDGQGFSDPVFRKRFKEQHGKEIEEDLPTASSEWQHTLFSNTAHQWEDIKFLQQHWDGPIVLKGIQHVDDARKAVELGVQGIVVSNHGGRQLDGAIGSLDVLQEIVQAVGSKITVLFDSGIRTGADIVKALALGAKAVMLGRPWVYGLAINGQEGVKSVLRSVCADLDRSMAMAGLATIADCKPEVLRKASKD